MSEEIFGDRRKALENSFFAKESETLRQKLQEQEGMTAKKEALSQASGIKDDAVLEQLMALDIGTDTLAALALVPLVEVAWADEIVDDKERDAILDAVEAAGIRKGSASGQLLDGWLAQKPGGDVVASWQEYISALCAEMGADAKNALKRDLLGRARSVAEATGGFLGLGSKVSKSEQAVLDELERAFS